MYMDRFRADIADGQSKVAASSSKCFIAITILSNLFKGLQLIPFQVLVRSCYKACNASLLNFTMIRVVDLSLILCIILIVEKLLPNNLFFAIFLLKFSSDHV